MLQLFEAELCSSWQEVADDGRLRTVRRIQFFSPQARRRPQGAAPRCERWCTVRSRQHPTDGPSLPCPSPAGPGQHALVVCLAALVPRAPAAAHHRGHWAAGGDDVHPGDRQLLLGLCAPVLPPGRVSAPAVTALRPHTGILSGGGASPAPALCCSVMKQYIYEINRRVHEFEGQSCTNLLWAMAALSVRGAAAAAGPLPSPACCAGAPPPCASRSFWWLRPARSRRTAMRLSGWSSDLWSLSSRVRTCARARPDGQCANRRASCQHLCCCQTLCPLAAAPGTGVEFHTMQYSQLLQAVLLAQFEQQSLPGDFRCAWRASACAP